MISNIVIIKTINPLNKINSTLFLVYEPAREPGSYEKPYKRHWNYCVCALKLMHYGRKNQYTGLK